ncbi:hypothetical protein [Mangrovicella endophytica]|uniref:hypothetical protein n=1 Tax=Mangrovicella endophytica TaxID=2066697 RepID=UPI000C9E44EA|nr:hypothetical protein [Mangrovicella endophytica]
MLTQLVTKLIAGEAGVFFARMRRVMALYAVMAAFALAMIGFLLAALYIFLEQRYGSLPTALGFAGGSFLLVILFWIMAVIARRPPHKRADDRLQRDIASIASVAALSHAPELFRTARRHKSLMLVPVAAAGAFGVWRLVTGRRYR